MKRKLYKSILPKPKPFKVNISPDKVRDMGIAVPKMSFEVVGCINLEKVFSGMVIPYPTVLIHYLTHTELMIISVILEETMINGGCRLNSKQISLRIGSTITTTYHHIYSLKKQGLIMERRCGMQKLREVNFKAVQHLNDICEGQSPEIMARIKKYSRKIDISRVTLDDVMNAYNNVILPPEHDIEEEEEYD